MVRNWDLLKGRNFLKLLDFTPEEIEYLLDLAADLKERKKKGIRVDYLVSKNIVLIFEKQVQEHAALLKQQLMTLVWDVPILIHLLPRLVKKKVLQILHVF